MLIQHLNASCPGANCKPEAVHSPGSCLCLCVSDILAWLGHVKPLRAQAVCIWMPVHRAMTYPTFLYMQIILSVAEHHSNLVPWQMLAARTGAVLKFVPLTKDQTELDLAVSRHFMNLHADTRKQRMLCCCMYAHS